MSTNKEIHTQHAYYMGMEATFVVDVLYHNECGHRKKEQLSDIVLTCTRGLSSLIRVTRGSSLPTLSPPHIAQEETCTLSQAVEQSQCITTQKMMMIMSTTSNKHGECEVKANLAHVSGTMTMLIVDII